MAVLSSNNVHGNDLKGNRISSATFLDLDTTVNRLRDVMEKLSTFD